MKEGAEVEVARGYERAQAELLGQGEGLVVVGFGSLAPLGLALRRDLAQAGGSTLVTSVRWPRSLLC